MAEIKALITVGGKQTLSLEASPLSGGGTSAPLASLAYVNNAGNAQLWLKTGATDLDWTMVQAGEPQDGWNVAYSIENLDVVSANAFFGSNASAFDGKITFVRRGNEMLEFTTDNTIETGRKFRVRNAANTVKLAMELMVSDTIPALKWEKDSQIFNQYLDSGTFYVVGETPNIDYQLNVRRIVENADASNGGFSSGQDGIRIIRRHKKYVSQVIPNSPLSLSVARAFSFGGSALSKGTITIVINGLVNSNPANAVFKKEFQCVGNTVVFSQDSLKSQDSGSEEADISFELGNVISSDTFSIQLKSLIGSVEMTGATVAIFLEEHMIG